MSGRIAIFDGMRGIAILCVLLGHGASGSLAKVTHFFGLSSFGVSYFFVLSGYLIFSITRREIEKTQGFNWKYFYLRRALRIFPCFYFYLLVVTILTISGVLNLQWQDLTSAATFTISYLHFWSETSPSYEAVGHYWTLALEEQFYLIWPLIVIAYRRDKIVPVLITVVLITPFLRLAGYYFMPDSRGQLAIMFPFACDSMAWGVLAAAVEKHTSIKPIVSWISKRGWTQFALLAVAMFGIPAFKHLVAFAIDPHIAGGFSLIIAKSLCYLAIAVLVAAVHHDGGKSLFSRLCCQPVLLYIGTLSYSLYVWNNLFLLSGRKWPVIGQFPVNFLCVIACAMLSYYVIEKPFLKMKERFKSSSRINKQPPNVHHAA